MANCRQRGKTDRRPAEDAGVIARHRVGNMKESNEPEVFDHLTINAAALLGSGRHQLLRKPGTVGNNAVIILLDSGADHNVIRKGLSTNVLRRKQAKAERFDGSTTTVQWINEVQESIDFDGFILADMVFSEWDLPPSHDVIFGKPFFDEYNPVINWRTHEVQLEPGLQSLHAAFQAEMDFFESAVRAADPDEERNAQERGAFFLEDANPDRLRNDDRSFLQEHELSPDKVEWLQTHPTPRSTWLPPAHISDTTFEKNLRLGSYEEVYRVKVSASAASEVVPGFLESLLAEYADVFPTELPDDLPKERAVEFELTMKPGAQPSSRAPFRLSRTEQDALDVFVRELLHKGLLEVSDSPWVSNIFGVPKKDATTGVAPSRSQWIKSGNSALPIRWVVDYRYINSQTEVPKIPLPRIDELFDQMVGCAVFSTIDLAQGYHQMRIATNSRKYTAFRTDKETYHWCVAPMGLSGMPGVWSRLMRLLFGRFAFVVVYLDDLCIYSHSEAEHCEHLRVVFDVLRSERLFARRSKCVFGAASVDFLDHTVSQEGLCVDKRKTHAIEQYPAPTTVKQLQSFLGLAGYYRRFIYGFAEIVLPLSELVKKVATWRWGEEHQRAFLQLKLHLQQAPVLQLPDFMKPFVVTTDASGRCCGGVLSQQTEGHDLPIAFFSKKLSDAEQNWPVHEQELFAIKLALSKWRHYLHGRPFAVYTDNSACTWFMAHRTILWIMIVAVNAARWSILFFDIRFPAHSLGCFKTRTLVLFWTTTLGGEVVSQYQ
ncbi:hypothetical protein PF008_g13339 [Phytophthora fragariae]|uniref:Reverse transcriptase domain-containing protein n=1 Tax=Phytophthora fragariae TaxID=53985 RepID=A0A6G0RLN3_9STRA|nr:hypothetical protein PF008_g13339 [Phytophthora fragariae]